MSSDIVRSNLNDKLIYAEKLSNASLLPRAYQRNPGNVLFALEYAEALGVSPIHAITSIHVIEGKPTASADLIAALIRRAGHKLRVTGDDNHATAVLIRGDDPDFEFRSEWTMDKARAAGLTGKGVWKNYPGAMLRSRAITEVARAGASDALFGVIYTPEELGAEVNAEGAPIDLGERPTPRPQPQPQQSGGSAAARLAAAAAQPAPEPDVDWYAEVDAAGGDIDALRAIYGRANNAGADTATLEFIRQAGIDAKATQAADTLTGELIDDPERQP